MPAGQQQALAAIKPAKAAKCVPSARTTSKDMGYTDTSGRIGTMWSSIMAPTYRDGRCSCGARRQHASHAAVLGATFSKCEG
eukprot:5073965-Amphidinium_carterae.2